MRLLRHRRGNPETEYVEAYPTAPPLDSTRLLTFSWGVCLYFSPEYTEIRPHNHLLEFSDLRSGLGCILVFATTGAILIWRSKRETLNKLARSRA